MHAQFTQSLALFSGILISMALRLRGDEGRSNFNLLGGKNAVCDVK